MIPNKRQPGDKMLARDQNALVDAARRSMITTGPGLSAKSGPGGTGLFQEGFGVQSWWGITTALGPDNDADYTDSRYWVKQIYITNSTGDSLDALTYDVADTIDIDGDVYTPESGKTIIRGHHITATNMAEVDAATHLLPVNDPDAVPATIGTIVKVYIVYDSRGISNLHYVFSAGFVPGTSDNPEVLGPLPEGPESASASYSASPSGSASASYESSDGIQLNVITRVVYNEDGNEILYGFYRTMLFDSVGLLVSISDETRYIIDTPGACP